MSLAAKEDTIFNPHQRFNRHLSSHRPIRAGIKIICEVVAVLCDLWVTVLWYCVAGSYVRDALYPGRSEVGGLTSHG